MDPDQAERHFAERTTNRFTCPALRAARARVEWRPSLAMLDEVLDEFCD
jgi:hypothetical protein